MTAAATETVTPSLSTLMREGSRAEHEAAESSSFMSELLAGRVSEQGYWHYLTVLRRVYSTMEAIGADLADDQIASAVVDRGVERLAAIDDDLQFWAEKAQAGGDVESSAADAYVARLEASREWGGLFVAHHYTRYLGDLSGGQAIGRILEREYGLEGDGVAFYRFVAVPKPKLYKDAYRARLDALPLDAAEQQRILAEVKTAFGLNGGLFAELTQHLPQYAR